MQKVVSEYTYIYLPALALILAFSALSVSAQTVSPTPKMSPVDEVLCSMGLGCPSTVTPTTTGNSTTNSRNNQNKVITGTQSSGGLFGRSSRNSQGILYGAFITKAFTSNDITLVRVSKSDSIPGTLSLDDQIYEIIRGKKHLIPTMDIFFDYAFKSQQVQFISPEQLAKYSEARIVKVKGDKTKSTYYITDSGMIRKIINQEIFESYGNRPEDIIEISRKEFNYYPENKYVYLERPYTGDIYLITGTTKRFLTPMALRRMNINPSQISPINQVEFNAYSTGQPVIF